MLRKMTGWESCRVSEEVGQERIGEEDGDGRDNED